jgi:pimeloyl-ACP methyl ester carboxylesterase
MNALSPQPNDVVVLVHGLAGHRAVMSPLARALRGHFSQVRSWGYSSLWARIERHGLALAKELRSLDERATGRIHLVTHSMGGIVGRLALAEYTPRHLGRVLMLAPPNRGSHLATRAAPYLGRFFPPIAQMCDDAGSFVASLPPVGAELGIIAASRDLLVREDATHLAGETDHITLPGRHLSLLWNRTTAEQVRHFLQHGRFHRPCEQACQQCTCEAAA